MLRLSDVTLARGTKRLIEHASIAVHAGQHVGIVGPNGAGKSSLFALLRGELLPDAGDVDVPASWTVAHVAQETPASDRPAIEWVLDEPYVQSIVFGASSRRNIETTINLINEKLGEPA